MQDDRNPWETPEWHLIQREAMLIRDLVGAGATALGRASYGDRMGEYYVAFFGLSLGIERLAKLILVSDYASTNEAMHAEKYVRGFGHDLKRLIEQVDILSRDKSLSPYYSRPSDPIAVAIIENLDAFADAKRGRYANYLLQEGSESRSKEPIEKWQKEVSDKILQTYYTEPIAEKAERNARGVKEILGDNVSVISTSESRDILRDVYGTSLRSGQQETVHKWARYHSLTIVRWLACVYHKVAEDAVCQKKCNAFFQSWEHLQCYCVDDRLMKARKVWPLK